MPTPKTYNPAHDVEIMEPQKESLFLFEGVPANRLNDEDLCRAWKWLFSNQKTLWYFKEAIEEVTSILETRGWVFSTTTTLLPAWRP